MIALMFLLEAATPWEALGTIGGGGLLGGAGFLYLLKRMIDRQETATKDNTKATNDLTLAFAKHQVGVSRDIEVLNESVITIRREMNDGFAEVHTRMDRGTKVHEELKEKIGKQSTNLKELGRKIDQRNGN